MEATQSCNSFWNLLEQQQFKLNCTNAGTKLQYNWVQPKILFWVTALYGLSGVVYCTAPLHCVLPKADHSVVPLRQTGLCKVKPTHSYLLEVGGSAVWLLHGNNRSEQITSSKDTCCVALRSYPFHNDKKSKKTLQDRKGGGCKGLPGWFGAFFSTPSCLREGGSKTIW